MNICNNNIAVQNFERCKKFKDKKFEIVKYYKKYYYDNDSIPKIIQAFKGINEFYKFNDKNNR